MTLLPPNATALERALEDATARLGDVRTPVDTLWDPVTCPIAILPWLAWGLSVDTWDTDWSEATKRRAVADSIKQHRHKGTRLSVEIVLARFDQLLTIVEWFEAQPPATPHSFDIALPLVTAAGTAPGGERASAAFAEAIIREVSRVKPLREHFQLVQSLAAFGGVGIQAVARVASFVRETTTLTIDTSPTWASGLQTEDGEPVRDERDGYWDTTP